MVFQVGLRLFGHLFRHLVALRFRECESVGDVDRQERVFVSLAIAFPQPEAAVVSLTRLKDLNIACELLVESIGGRHILRLEGRENILHRGDRDHPRRDLLGAGVRIVRQIDERVGEFLKLRRAGCDLQSAELRIDITRRLNRLDDRSIFLGRAVGRERLGRRGRPYRKRDLGCVGERA